jgi:hypothetical protein
VIVVRVVTTSGHQWPPGTKHTTHNTQHTIPPTLDALVSFGCRAGRSKAVMMGPHAREGAGWSAASRDRGQVPATGRAACRTTISEHHEHLCCNLEALKQTESTPGVVISMISFLTPQSKDTASLAQKRCSWISLRNMLRTFTCDHEIPDFTCASK